MAAATRIRVGHHIPGINQVGGIAIQRQPPNNLHMPQVDMTVTT